MTEDQAPDVLKLRGPEKPGIKRPEEEDRHPGDQKTQRIEDKMGGGHQICLMITHVESDRELLEG